MAIVNSYCLAVILASCFLIYGVVSQCEFATACVADVIDYECTDGEVMAPFGGIFGCCPGCQKPSDVEPPSSCGNSSSCLPDGRYAPVQCKGDLFTGRCFCSDENGRRIFGQMWRNEANEMTCACSRKRAELEAQGNRVVTLHCTPTGDYEPLQCDDGLCWCAEPETGQPTVSPVPQADMTRLPCYEAGLVGEQYLRRCESVVQAMAMISGEQSAHGTSFLGNPTAFCDYDGSYGPYQIVNGIAYCTGRDGEILGSWQVVSSEMFGMTCNCARDSTMYFPEKGMTVTEICQANGNYRPNQNVGDVYYCVDTDGYPTTEMMDSWPDDRCANYAY